MSSQPREKTVGFIGLGAQPGSAPPRRPATAARGEAQRGKARPGQAAAEGLRERLRDFEGLGAARRKSWRGVHFPVYRL
jgi:hypothetical protein